MNFRKIGTIKLPQRQIIGSSYTNSGGTRNLKGMAEHTGQSSQLFPVTTGRNAQFLAAVAKHSSPASPDLTLGLLNHATLPAAALS
jgi:hypothetical protein